MAAGRILTRGCFLDDITFGTGAYLSTQEEVARHQASDPCAYYALQCLRIVSKMYYIHTYQYILPNQLVIFEEISDLSLLGCCSIIACSDGYLSQKNPEFVAPLPIKGLTAWMTKDRTWKNGMGSKHKGERERGADE